MCHPIRVAAQLSDPFERAVGLLHDVLEDTPIKASYIQEMFGDDGRRLANALLVLTRESGETYEAFIDRIAASGNAAAIRVKIADLRDNSMGHMPPDKESLRPRYRQAIARLEGVLT